jgi:hypothetical protein
MREPVEDYEDYLPSMTGEEIAARTELTKEVGVHQLCVKARVVTPPTDTFTHDPAQIHKLSDEGKQPDLAMFQKILDLLIRFDDR